jgi:hypothetical protein
MSIETKVLLENITAESAGSVVSYGNKNKGAGYHKNNNGMHTIFYQFDNFIGSVNIQGTLELYPGDNDWVDVDGTLIEISDSSALTSNEVRNFVGKFVYIRAAYNLQNGTISEIRYNY